MRWGPACLWWPPVLCWRDGAEAGDLPAPSPAACDLAELHRLPDDSFPEAEASSQLFLAWRLFQPVPFGRRGPGVLALLKDWASTERNGGAGTFPPVLPLPRLTPDIRVGFLTSSHAPDLSPGRAPAAAHPFRWGREQSYVSSAFPTTRETGEVVCRVASWQCGCHPLPSREISLPRKRWWMSPETGFTSAGCPRGLSPVSQGRVPSPQSRGIQQGWHFKTNLCRAGLEPLSGIPLAVAARGQGRRWSRLEGKECVLKISVTKGLGCAATREKQIRRDWTCLESFKHVSTALLCFL